MAADCALHDGQHCQFRNTAADARHGNAIRTAAGRCIDHQHSSGWSMLASSYLRKSSESLQTHRSVAGGTRAAQVQARGSAPAERTYFCKQIHHPPTERNRIATSNFDVGNQQVIDNTSHMRVKFHTSAEPWVSVLRLCLANDSVQYAHQDLTAVLMWPPKHAAQ